MLQQFTKSFHFPITLQAMLALMAMFAIVGAISFAVQPTPVSADSPTNLEVLAIMPATDEQGNIIEDQWLAILQWDYQAADTGYWVTINEGSSDDICDMAGKYPSGANTITVTTRRAPNLTPGNWYISVYSIGESFPRANLDNITCGNVLSFTQTGARSVGPIQVGNTIPDLEDLDTPTGLGATQSEYRKVVLEWDSPEDRNGTSGYIIRRKWLGQNANTVGLNPVPSLCIWYSDNSLTPRVVDDSAYAYDYSGTQNKYEYKLYPINTNYKPASGKTCDDAEPASTPAVLEVTVDTSPDHAANNGKISILSYPTPTGFALKTRYRWTNGQGPRIIATWSKRLSVPAYQLRFKEASGDGEWIKTFTIHAQNYPNMGGADGTSMRPAPGRHRTLPTDMIASNVRYTYQVGTCNNPECNEINWSSATRSIVAASNPRASSE